MDDAKLLREFRHGSRAALDELIQRHAPVVYAAALRSICGNRALADEVASRTFLLLARKASSLGAEVSIVGWIYKSACNVARDLLRAESRRSARELEAMQMHTVPASSEPAWESLAPALDQAMLALSDSDRLAILLRYFQAKPLAEVAQILGVSEGSVKMRLQRALERLRKQFVAQGLTCSTGALALLLSANAAPSAPLSFLEKLSDFLANNLANHTGQAGFAAQIIAFMTTSKLTGASAILLILLLATVGRQYLRTSEAPPKDSGSARALAPAPGTESVFVARSERGGLAQHLGLTQAIDSKTQALLDQLKEALHAAPAEGVRSYPSEDVFKALENLGANKALAFGLLQLAVADPNQEVWKRAISAMGLLGSGSPAARIFLRELLFENSDKSDMALTSLRNLGFEPSDLNDLTAVLQDSKRDWMRRYVPEAIADLVSKNGEAGRAQLGKVEALLNHSDPAIQFGTACALARIGGDPSIYARVAEGLTSSEYQQQLMAIEALGASGPAAASAISLLAQYAQTTEEEPLKNAAWTALGKIDPKAAEVLPEVRRIKLEEERLQMWADKWGAKDYTLQDLEAALKEDRQKAIAAELIAQAHTNAPALLPQMLAALDGSPQNERSRILKAIQAIDPAMEVPRVERRSLIEAMVETLNEFELRPKEQQPKDIEKALMDIQVRANWYTYPEIQEFSRRLAPDKAVHQKFVRAAIRSNPKLKPVLEANN